MVEFDFEKDTPGTHRYKERDVPVGQRAKIGTLYILKSALDDIAGPAGAKGGIRVTIEKI